VLADSADGSLADEDPPRIGRLLEPSSGVHRVAGHHELGRLRLPARDHLAAVHAEADRDSIHQRGVGPDAIAQVDRRKERPGGIVVVGNRQPEHRHDRVADELLDPTAVLLDGIAGNGEEPAEERPDVLGIERLAERGRADDVGEQDRDEPALFAHGGMIAASPQARQDEDRTISALDRLI
jgi:hypothetical protein